MKKILCLIIGTMMMHVACADVGNLLGSGRNDLWVFGSDRNVADGSKMVMLETGRVPLSDWFWSGAGREQVTWRAEYSERPVGWNWKEKPASQLGTQEPYHLSKYDDHSAFSFYWGYGFDKDGTINYAGAVLSFSNGHLVLTPNGLAAAREKYKLSESQDFVGMVGDKVFFYDAKEAGQLIFFDIARPNARFKLEVPVHRDWKSSWKLERVVQVFDGDRNGEITAQVWVKNIASFSARPRRSSAGMVLDLSTAVPMN